MLTRLSTTAGGGAYVFAKRSINADRASRHIERESRKADARRLEQAARQAEAQNQAQLTSGPRATDDKSTVAEATGPSRIAEAATAIGPAVHDDDVSDPSTEIGHDPAPTRHEPDTERQQVTEKGKYETTEPYRPPRGNRLS